MGAAAYNRGSRAIASSIARDFPRREVAFEIMDRINAIPKRYSSATGRRLPSTGGVYLQPKAGGGFLMTPIDDKCHGSPKEYDSLESAITDWDIFLLGYDETTGVWVANSI